MPAVSAIIEEVVDGAGYIQLPNVMSAAEAAEARTRALEIAASPDAATLGRRHERTGQQHIRGLLAHGEIFERMAQYREIVEIAEAMLGDDMTLGAYSARILYPGAIEMGVHIDYPYWAMRGPFTLRPPMMVQVIWMLQDFTEQNGATLVAPRSQLLCTRPNREDFRRVAIKITGAAGDAIVSHGLLWHDTAQNHTEQPRVSLLINLLSFTPISIIFRAAASFKNAPAITSGPKKSPFPLSSTPMRGSNIVGSRICSYPSRASPSNCGSR